MTSRKSDLLSICIPTYNHAEPLRKCLKAMVAQAKKYDIPIYVSDNASTDNTMEILESYRKTYPFLYFKSNPENLGVDKNMVNAVQMASTKYVWAFGSRRVLLPGMLDKVYNILSKENLDLLVLNDLNSTFMVPKSRHYNSAKQVFRELNRNLTGLGFQVLPLAAWKSEYVAKYANTEWTIFGVAIEFIADKPNLNAFFLSDPCAAPSGMSHWLPRSFQIWTNWKKIIRSLPTIYSDEDKEFVLRKSVNYFFQGPKFNLVFLRIQNIYNYETFNAYKEDIAQYGGISPRVAIIISRCPIWLLKGYFKVYHTLRALARIFIHVKSPLNPTARRERISYN